MNKILSADEYKNTLKERGILPAGFSIGLTSLNFSPEESGGKKEMKMNISMILLDQPTEVFAGVFTKNKFPGAPVHICKDRLNKKTLRGIMINNKIANVCIDTGIKDAEVLLERASNLLGCEKTQMMIASTGVIGWRLPVSDMTTVLDELVKAAKNDKEKNAAALSSHIMTTDRFPKLRSKELLGGRITAVAKGAGMIEPNMATMLCFIMTDLAISRKDLREMLSEITAKTLNRISVDGDQSTSDMVIAMSSNKIECSEIDQIKKALTEICTELAEDIVRNGEGTSHVIRVKVNEAETEEQACNIGKAIVNSPLVKTAIAGNDPNVGRIISAIGDYCGNNDISITENKLEISLGDSLIFANGSFTLDSKKEEELSKYLADCSMPGDHKGSPIHNKSVEINITVGTGSSCATITGSDLTHEYVSENADYRT